MEILSSITENMMKKYHIAFKSLQVSGVNLGGRLRRHLEDFSPESELSWTLGRRSLCYETKKTLGKVNGLYYLIFIHSFITLCHTTSISGIQFLSNIFRTPLQG